jgi:outer membrane receptor protein involved in Fe transport
VEPLPGILPLESRVGLRLHDSADEPDWAAEFSVRMVNQQNRVATSLLETPTAGFATCDLRGYWRPWEKLLLVAGVENVFDQNYREHLDFRAPNGNDVLQPGVNFYFGAEVVY